jgi:hypothetical protein
LAQLHGYNPRIGVWALATGIMGFSDIRITGRYIYAVFHGRTFKDIQTVAQQGGKHEDGGRYIYVFDLKGNPVRKYTLDRAVYGIDVHEDTSTIFATDVNSVTRSYNSKLKVENEEYTVYTC